MGTHAAHPNKPGTAAQFSACAYCGQTYSI